MATTTSSTHAPASGSGGGAAGPVDLGGDSSNPRYELQRPALPLGPFTMAPLPEGDPYVRHLRAMPPEALLLERSEGDSREEASVRMVV